MQMLCPQVSLVNTTGLAAMRLTQVPCEGAGCAHRSSVRTLTRGLNSLQVDNYALYCDEMIGIQRTILFFCFFFFQ